jgi:glutamate carboxypeptidase
MLDPAKAQTWADQHLDEMTSLLEEVVLINSHTANKEGVDAVGRVFKSELEAMGLEVETVPQAEHGDLLIASSVGAENSGNLMLCGHMDTVFPVDTAFNWFRSDGAKCFGPGVADMKGGLVVALYALKLLAQEDLLSNLSLKFLLNSDEETGSPISGPLIKELAAQSSAALVFECGGENGQVVTGRKGKLGLRLNVTGRAGHAGYPGAVKSSALLEMAHKIVALEDLNGLTPGLTINVGKAIGGSAPNVIAQHAEALIDIRLPDPESEAIVNEEIQRIASGAQVRGTKSLISRLSGRPAMPVCRANLALFEEFKSAAALLDMEIDHEFRGGVSDANYIATQGAAVLDGLGPVGGNDHSDQEFIIQKSLVERTALTALMVASLGQRLQVS